MLAVCGACNGKHDGSTLEPAKHALRLLLRETEECTEENEGHSDCVDNNLTVLRVGLIAFWTLH